MLVVLYSVFENITFYTRRFPDDLGRTFEIQMPLAERWRWSDEKQNSPLNKILGNYS